MSRLTEYEKIRAQNIIRNNQLLERLGFKPLLVNNVGAESKGAGNEQDEVSKVPVPLGIVMRLEQKDKSARVTRQRTDDRSCMANEELVGLRHELHLMKLQAQEFKTTMAKQSHEIESLKETVEETNALLRRMLNVNKP
ncbi:hypothetical protein ACP70R_031793 [Stipagrostis hirtigluma subsp. patula]